MLTFEVVQQKAYFNPRKYVARVYRDGVRIDDSAFVGNDGRSVRACAIHWAHKRMAQLFNTGV